MNNPFDLTNVTSNMGRGAPPGGAAPLLPGAQAMMPGAAMPWTMPSAGTGSAPMNIMPQQASQQPGDSGLQGFLQRLAMIFNPGNNPGAGGPGNVMSDIFNSRQPSPSPVASLMQKPGLF